MGAKLRSPPAAAVGRMVNRADLAEIMGVSLPTLDTWIRRGCPYLREGGKGKEWRLNTRDVIEWRLASAVEGVAATYGAEAGRISREEADRRRAIAQAVAAEVAADEALERVVDLGAAQEDLAGFVLALKTGLANAAAKIAARAAAVKSAPDIQELAEAEMNRAFETARGELLQRGWQP